LAESSPLGADPSSPVDTGIHVGRGATYTMDASGSTDYCLSPGVSRPSGPDGAANRYGFGCGAPPDQCPVPSALLGTLIGKHGSGPYFREPPCCRSVASSASSCKRIDGNLVLYTSSGRALSESHTYPSPGASAVLQRDGNFVIYSVSGMALWDTRT